MEKLTEVGTIISTFSTPNTDSFRFLISNPVVKKEQFIQFNTEEGIAIARVSEIIKTNRYFMQAESVKDYEESGLNMESIFPVKDWEYLVGEGTILGIYDSEGQKRPSFPPSPGTKVFLVDENLLEKFLGLDLKNGINIGKVLFQNINASLNMEKLLRKHLAILAKSGAGKSYLASIILEELLERNEEDSLSIIVVDPHGEYVGFAEDENYLNKVKIFRSRDISFSTRNLSSSNLSKIYELKPAQVRELEKIITKLRNEKPNFDLNDVEREILDSKMNQKTMEILLSHLWNLRELDLFKRFDNPSLDDFELGKMVILDLSDSTDNKKRQIIVDMIASKLFYARINNKVPPFLLLVEEAHNFAPEQIAKSEAISRGTLIKIAREGRKFGASLCLISQRPVNLSTTILSQCNTHIFLRVTNPYDLKHIEESSEGITPEVRKSIPGLRVGDCIIVGEAVNYPIFARIRRKKSKDVKAGTLKDLVRDYLNQKIQMSEDVEAFMR